VLDPCYIGLGALPNLSALVIVLDLTNYQVQTPWVEHVCQIHAILGLTHCQAQEPWTRLTTTFKRIGFDIRVDPRYLRLGVSPNALDLTCVPEPHHLGLGTLPSPNALDLAKCHVQMLHTA